MKELNSEYFSYVGSLTSTKYKTIS